MTVSLAHFMRNLAVGVSCQRDEDVTRINSFMRGLELTGLVSSCTSAPSQKV